MNKKKKKRNTPHLPLRLQVPVQNFVDGVTSEDDIEYELTLLNPIRDLFKFNFDGKDIKKEIKSDLGIFLCLSGTHRERMTLIIFCNDLNRDDPVILTVAGTLGGPIDTIVGTEMSDFGVLKDFM